MARGAAIAQPALVLTRPRDAAFEFARTARQAGISGSILFSPVLRIVPETPSDVPDGTLVFTSRQGAIRAADLGLTDRPAIAVGQKTASIARARGFECQVGPGDVAGLTAMLSRTRDPLVHLHGRHVTGDLVGHLRKAGHRIVARVVYDQRETTLSDAARRSVCNAATLLPLFSSRTAALVSAQLSGTVCRATVVALSPAVANAWTLGKVLHIATEPNAAAMLAILRALVGRHAGR